MRPGSQLPSGKQFAALRTGRLVAPSNGSLEAVSIGCPRPVAALQWRQVQPAGANAWDQEGVGQERRIRRRGCGTAVRLYLFRDSICGREPYGAHGRRSASAEPTICARVAAAQAAIAGGGYRV